MLSPLQKDKTLKDTKCIKYPCHYNNSNIHTCMGDHGTVEKRQVTTSP